MARFSTTGSSTSSVGVKEAGGAGVREVLGAFRVAFLQKRGHFVSTRRAKSLGRPDALETARTSKDTHCRARNQL